MTDFSDSRLACDALHEAARLMREDRNREGSLLRFGSAGQLVVTGDMHGNLRNFEKLQRFCALDRSPARSVLLHELIHQEPANGNGMDLSIDLLVRAAAWKTEYPDSVFFIQSNHELSQYRGHEITKGGRCVLLDFERGVAQRFGRKADDVMDGVMDYLGSLPLAVRCANGVFVAHSLPDPLVMDVFDETVFQRTPTPEDMAPGGSAYWLVWGRFQSPTVVDYFARKLGVDVFIVGHTPQETGYAVVGRMIILASDHNHGVFLPVDLSRKASVEQLEAGIRKFVSVE